MSSLSTIKEIKFKKLSSSNIEFTSLHGTRTNHSSHHMTYLHNTTFSNLTAVSCDQANYKSAQWNLSEQNIERNNQTFK